LVIASIAGSKNNFRFKENDMNSLLTSYAPAPKVLLPVVSRMVQQLNSLYLSYAGAVGRELADGVYRQWLRTGKTGPSGLRQYAYSLGVQLDSPLEQHHFRRQADELLLNLQSGYLS
jgi:hypothetical protein